ncbi:MAG: hypothetical protein HYZ68_01370 [Chloroflexi bacterium]|nr:hypothetical protein [Chloroflexota bacterium]
MGLLSDFFIMPAEEMDLFDVDSGPAGNYPTVQAKRIEVVKLSTLHPFLTGADL